MKYDKVDVQLVQLNKSYGNQYFIPYSIGLVVSYLKKFKDLYAEFNFKPFLYKRDSVEKLAHQVGNIDILGISCYMWNWNLSMTLAERVKAANPGCIIIIGGPSIPNDASKVFNDYPFIDILCYGEGEHTFSEILEEYINNKDYRNIKDITWFHRDTGLIIENMRSDETLDLDDIPSPYTTGVFDDLLNKEENWMALWETNRGCPYSCAFCYWGKATNKKLRKFDMTKLEGEISWFSKNKIEVVFGCDSNFGILKRDNEIVSKLVESKRTSGYPKTFRVCFSKNSNKTVFEIESMLYEENMSKGVSLSMQSLNPNVLNNIGRKNIDIRNFKELQGMYLEKGMSTYSEMIIGLPGETFNSFVNGIEVLLKNGQHSGMNIYNCTIIPNSEMAEKGYQEKHKIETVTIPIFQAHSSRLNSKDEIIEYEPIIISTSTLPVDDWKRAYHFSWAVQCFHYLGPLQAISIFMNYAYRIPYGKFYKEFIRFSGKKRNTFLYKELKILNSILDNVLKGEGFDQYLPEFLDISWPVEEATFLRLEKDIDAFYSQVRLFIEEIANINNVEVPPKLLDDLILYQKSILIKFDCKSNFYIELSYDLPEYISNCKLGKVNELNEGAFKYDINIEGRIFSDIKEFAQEAVWYGRKGGKFYYKAERLNDE